MRSASDSAVLRRALSEASARERRLDLLLALVEQWLIASAVTPAVARSLSRQHGRSLSEWLSLHGTSWVEGSGESLAQFLIESAGQSGWPHVPQAPALLAALARACLDQATSEVEVEARHAGHGDSFDALRPYLTTDLPKVQASQLERAIGLSGPAIEIALRRLRRRIQQRVLAALALWSASPEQASWLRRQLWSAMFNAESSS